MAPHVVPGAHVPVPLGEPPEQAAEPDGHGLLEVPRVLGRGGRRGLLPLLGLVRVVEDDVTVWRLNGELAPGAKLTRTSSIYTERSSVVQLDHGRPLVRVEEVDDGDGQADHEAEGSGDYDEPEAPAELEGELRGMMGILNFLMEN